MLQCFTTSCRPAGNPVNSKPPMAWVINNPPWPEHYPSHGRHCLSWRDPHDDARPLRQCPALPFPSSNPPTPSLTHAQSPSMFAMFIDCSHRLFPSRTVPILFREQSPPFSTRVQSPSQSQASMFIPKRFPSVRQTGHARTVAMTSP